MSRQILLIEDDDALAGQIGARLNQMPCKLKQVRDGGAGIAEAASGKYDLVVLDLAPDAADDLEICRRIRAGARYMPIIMLSSRASELDRVLGLELGADHYLTKPVSVPELVARIKAVFRLVDRLAGGASEEPDLIRFGDMKIDAQRHEVSMDGKPVDLTAKEFQLLLCLARNPGRVYTRGQLLDQVWGYHHSGYEHTVNSHINRLRAKIEEDPDQPEYIQTIWGVGYKFREPARQWNRQLRQAA